MNSQYLPKLLILLALPILMVAYQQCAPVNFQNSQGSNAKTAGELVLHNDMAEHGGDPVLSDGEVPPPIIPAPGTPPPIVDNPVPSPTPVVSIPPVEDPAVICRQIGLNDPLSLPTVDCKKGREKKCYQLCHKGRNTLRPLSSHPSIPGHLRHGDTLGLCGQPESNYCAQAQ